LRFSSVFELRLEHAAMNFLLKRYIVSAKRLLKDLPLWMRWIVLAAILLRHGIDLYALYQNIS